MHEHIVHLLSTYGYWGLYGALAIEYLFIPVPGETTLTTVGILWQRPAYHLSLPWLILATSLGTFTGALFGYAVGRAFGRPVLERFGKYIRITPARIDQADVLFAKYTVPTLLLSRYIAGIRIIVPYIAGINKVRIATYIPTVLLGSFLWTSTFILAGSVIEHSWGRIVTHWKRDLIPAVLIAALAVVAYVYVHRWMNRKLHDATEADSQASDSENAPRRD